MTYNSHIKHENKSRAAASSDSTEKKTGKSVATVIDNRSEVVTQRKHQEMANRYLQVTQLTKSDSPIPKKVSDYFEERGTTYHQFKQNNWSQIAVAHERAHGSPPDTTGASYTIDAKTGDELINLLGPDWQPHDAESRAAAIDASAIVSRERRGAAVTSTAAAAAASSSTSEEVDSRQITLYDTKKLADKAISKGRVPTTHYRIKGDNTIYKV